MYKSAVLQPVEILCPICNAEMVKSIYMGKRHVVKDVGHVGYQPFFADDLRDENAELNWVAVVGSRVGWR